MNPPDPGLVYTLLAAAIASDVSGGVAFVKENMESTMILLSVFVCGVLCSCCCCSIIIEDFARRQKLAPPSFVTIDGNADGHDDNEEEDLADVDGTAAMRLAALPPLQLNHRLSMDASQLQQQLILTDRYGRLPGNLDHIKCACDRMLPSPSQTLHGLTLTLIPAFNLHAARASSARRIASIQA